MGRLRGRYAITSCKTTIGALLLTAALLCGPQAAHAYLDPGSGSFLIQILVAGLLGAGVALKVYWRKVKAFFTPGARRPSDESPDE